MQTYVWVSDVKRGTLFSPQQGDRKPSSAAAPLLRRKRCQYEERATSKNWKFEILRYKFATHKRQFRGPYYVIHSFSLIKKLVLSCTKQKESMSLPWKNTLQNTPPQANEIIPPCRWRDWWRNCEMVRNFCSFFRAAPKLSVSGTQNI